jgi:hypothetical protein
MTHADAVPCINRLSLTSGGFARCYHPKAATTMPGSPPGTWPTTTAVSPYSLTPAVAGVIIGTRLGVAEHRAENARVFSFRLDAADWARLDAVHARSRDLFALIGDCGDEYRR